MKRVTRPMLGGKALAAAQDTLVGIARMHMLKKSQRVSEAGDEGRTAAEPFSALAASSPHRREFLPPKRLLVRNCDKTHGRLSCGLFKMPSSGLSYQGLRKRLAALAILPDIDQTVGPHSLRWSSSTFTKCIRRYRRYWCSGKFLHGIQHSAQKEWLLERALRI